MTEYSALDTSLNGKDRYRRNKQYTYTFVDPRLLKRAPVRLIKLIQSEQYTGEIEKINEKTKEKIIESSENIHTFKRIIRELRRPFFNVLKDGLISIIDDYKTNNLLDEEDLDVLSELGYTNEVIETTTNNVELSVNNIIKEKVTVEANNDSTNKAIDSTVLKVDEIIEEEKVDHIQLIRINSTIVFKNKENKSPEEYLELKKEFEDKLKNLVRLNLIYTKYKDKLRNIDFVILLIENNPELLYNNSYVNSQGGISFTNKLADLLDIYMNSNIENHENFEKKLKKYKGSKQDFLKHLYTTLGAVKTRENLVLGLKKTIYSI